MDAIEALTTRRSCRSFKQEQIKNEELQTILACGLNAPSGKINNQVKLWLFKIKKKLKNFQNLMRLFLERC